MGIEEARKTFRRQLEIAVADAKRGQSLAFRRGIGSPSAMSAGYAAFRAEMWARAERFALEQGHQLSDDFDTAVWEPISEAVERGWRTSKVELEKLRQLQSDRKPAPPWRGFEKDFAVLENQHATLEPSLLELAALAKRASRPDLVQQVFRFADGRLGDFQSAEAYLAAANVPAPLSKTDPTARPPVPPNPAPPPITLEERTAIHRLVANYAAAMNARDVKRLSELFNDPQAFRELWANRKNSTLYEPGDELPHVDPDQASITLWRRSENGPITAVIRFGADEPGIPENAKLDVADGEQRAAKGSDRIRMMYDIVFLDGSPLFVLPKESSEANQR